MRMMESIDPIITGFIWPQYIDQALLGLGPSFARALSPRGARTTRAPGGYAGAVGMTTWPPREDDIGRPKAHTGLQLRL